MQSASVDELHDFSESLTSLRSDLLAARRFTSQVALADQANTLRTFLLDERDDAVSEEEKEAAVECLGYLERIHASTQTEIRHVSNPEASADDFRDSAVAFLKDHGLDPFIPS